jgi:Phage integrase family
MTRQALKSEFETAVRIGSFDGSVAENTPPLDLPKQALLPVTGVHPAVIKIALSAVAWFLAVAWLDFSGGPEVDLRLAVVTSLFIMFFTLFLVTASMVINDPRWKHRFHDIRHDVGTKLLRDTGNLKLVRRALNHADIMTTTRYAHVLDEEVAEPLERVGAAGLAKAHCQH